MPLLELDNGERLAEGPAIVQYIADQVPAKKLAPANGTMARARLQEWLTFIGTELHKGVQPAVQSGDAGGRTRRWSRPSWPTATSGSTPQLEGKDYLMGSDFSVADPYLFTVDELGPARRRRHLAVQERRGLHGAHGGAPCGAGRRSRPKA